VFLLKKDAIPSSLLNELQISIHNSYCTTLLFNVEDFIILFDSFGFKEF